MSFLYPLGLLGLIGIPILIIIYIIKSKYAEHTVTSTYLWTLSEKFLKKKNPLSHVSGLISLILQILAVTVISLLIAHPIITVPNSANEYCFIFDASGSMRMEKDGVTRFERGKERIAETIDDAGNGSIFSLVCVGDSTTVMFERTNDKEKALAILDQMEPTFAKDDFTDALGHAQSYFNANPSTLTYLVTDKSYQINNNITLVDVSAEERNASIGDGSYSYVSGAVTVNGSLTSYSEDGEFTLNLYIDGADGPSASTLIFARAGEPTAFQLTAPVESFSSLRVAMDGEDALAADNEFILFNSESEDTYNTLLVSDTPFFLQSALEALTDARIKVMSEEEYTGQSGYGLYIFDSYSPDTLPRDGAIWIVNPTSSIADAGFSIQADVRLGKGESLDLTESTSSAARAFVDDMTGDDFVISRYVKCGLYRNFTTILSYKGNPVVFAGTNNHGNREVVFALDLHDTNFPLLYDYLVLLRNLSEYSFPDIVEKTDHTCGDTAQINLPVGTESVKVTSPSGEVSYPDASGAVSSFLLDEVGAYTVTLTVADTQKEFSIYSAMIKEESFPAVAEQELSIQGEAKSGGFAGEYDPLIALFIALAVIFLADWMVYCYEKYQLR